MMRNQRRGLYVLFALSLFAASLSATQARADKPILQKSPTKDVSFEQHLGEPVNLDLQFKDENGQDIQLGDYFHEDRPVVLALVYYECPMLCTMVLNGVVRSLRPLSLSPSKDFEVVIVSFNPKEGPELAKKKREGYLKSYDRPGTEAGWHFLTGQPAAIDSLTSECGFHYVYDEATGQYAHATGIMVLTPKGVLSRYLYGIDYAPKDLRLSLAEASDGKVGGLVAQALLLCFKYNPSTGKYGATIMFFIRLAGVLTILVIVGFIFWSRRRDRRAHHQQAGGVA
jgi:protein SCO1/2